MAKIPAGLTSSVSAEGKSFILQTEFIATNGAEDSGVISGRIKTTVAVSGQVVHKVEKAYIGAAETSDPLLAAEKAVKKQHLQVAKTVDSKPREFMASVSELTVSAEDRLGLIPGIVEVTPVDLKNLEEFSTDDVNNPLLRNMELIRSLVVTISQSTRLGKLQKMVGAVEDKKFLLTGFDGGTFLLGLKDDADVVAIFNELDRVKS